MQSPSLLASLYYCYPLVYKLLFSADSSYATLLSFHPFFRYRFGRIVSSFFHLSRFYLSSPLFENHFINLFYLLYVFHYDSSLSLNSKRHISCILQDSTSDFANYLFSVSTSLDSLHKDVMFVEKECEKYRDELPPLRCKEEKLEDETLEEMFEPKELTDL